MLGLTFKSDIDVGVFLTFLTLIAGFVWWLYTSIRTWRRTSFEEARSGALRLLLRLLRERRGAPISIRFLYAEFSAPQQRNRRKAYCRRNFKFKDEATFESAVYRLDWEGKIDFVTTDEIVFRVHRTEIQAPPFLLSNTDPGRIVDIFRQSCSDPKIDSWELEKLARTSMRVAPTETSALIHEILHDSSSPAHVRVAVILNNLPIKAPDTTSST